MKSTVTVKYQTTIPKEVRERMGILVHDVLDWEEIDGRIPILSFDRKLTGGAARLGLPSASD